MAVTLADYGIELGRPQDGKICAIPQRSGTQVLQLTQGRARYWVASRRQRSLREPCRT